MKYYAEYLSNINFVGVYFETESEALNPSTIATDQDGNVAILNFSEGSENRLILPATVRQISTKLSSNATSVRIPVMKPLNISKSALKLPPQCICDSVLTGPEVKWKRLPSEHWAELMDLWHCHKPSEPTQGGKTLYDLAINGFHAHPGQAFFSDTYFLVHQADIARAEHSPDCKLVADTRLCDGEGKSTKLWKWDLDTGPVGRVVSEILMELIDAHAVYTYEINGELIIWVFNPNVMYTITGAGSPAYGCKVFFGSAPQLRQQRPDAETIDLPDPVYKKLVQELEVSNARLPNSVGGMGKWRLAIL